MFVSKPVAPTLHCYAISDKEMLLHKDDRELSFEDVLSLSKRFPEEDFFSEPDNSLSAVNIPSPLPQELLEEFKVVTLRELFAGQGEEKSFHAFRSKAILVWRKTHRFCGSCGAALEEHSTLSARVCPSCKKIHFPRIEPCIIVVVRKEGKVLLAKHTYRNQDIYACIAGFMEAGESAEQAVAREVFEETGIKIKNITYRGSQSWPFPGQLMLGFTADYDSGELVLQEDEIADAQFFDPDDCPASPKPGSIAYRLIHGLY